MTIEKRTKFTVITNEVFDLERETVSGVDNNNQQGYHTNPMYQKLLNFRNLQEQQKKKFSVEDLLKW